MFHNIVNQGRGVCPLKKNMSPHTDKKQLRSFTEEVWGSVLLILVTFFNELHINDTALKAWTFRRFTLIIMLWKQPVNLHRSNVRPACNFKIATSSSVGKSAEELYQTLSHSSAGKVSQRLDMSRVLFVWDLQDPIKPGDKCLGHKIQDVDQHPSQLKVGFTCIMKCVCLWTCLLVLIVALSLHCGDNKVGWLLSLVFDFKRESVRMWRFAFYHNALTDKLWLFCMIVTWREIKPQNKQRHIW